MACIEYRATQADETQTLNSTHAKPIHLLPLTSIVITKLAVQHNRQQLWLSTCGHLHSTFYIYNNYVETLQPVPPRNLRRTNSRGVRQLHEESLQLRQYERGCRDDDEAGPYRPTSTSRTTQPRANARETDHYRRSSRPRRMATT